MTAGTRVYTVRLNDYLVTRIAVEIARARLARRTANLDLSDFIRVALHQRCDRLAAGRRRFKRRLG